MVLGVANLFFGYAGSDPPVAEEPSAAPPEPTVSAFGPNCCVWFQIVISTLLLHEQSERVVRLLK